MAHTLNVKYLLAVVMLAFFVAPSTEDLDDWKAALSASKNSKGCESIPYAKHRADCVSASAKVEELCKTEAWSCDRMGTKALKDEMERLADYIKRLTNKQTEMISDKSRATSTEEKTRLEKEIAEREKLINTKEAELSKQKSRLAADLVKIEARLQKGEDCEKARTKVQAIFAEAGKDAARESSLDIKPIAKTLIDYWETKRDEHQKALSDVKLGVARCKGCKDGKF